MKELLQYLESKGIPIPLDIAVKAIMHYGYIIEDNYPQEDYIYGE